MPRLRRLKNRLTTPQNALGSVAANGFNQTNLMARIVQIDRFEFERVLWTQGVVRVAGVDEAGRGPLAGPVVAAAAVLPSKWAESGLPHELEGLNDSKQLTGRAARKIFCLSHHLRRSGIRHRAN